MPVTSVCTMAPGTTTRRTAARSLNEKWSPTPNMSSTTPSSAAWLVNPESET